MEQWSLSARGGIVYKQRECALLAHHAGFAKVGNEVHGTMFVAQERAALSGNSSTAPE